MNTKLVNGKRGKKEQGNVGAINISNHFSKVEWDYNSGNLLLNDKRVGCTLRFIYS